MTDAEKIRIYEKNLNIEAMMKINAAIAKGEDVEIQQRKDYIVMFSRKAIELARVKR